MEPIPKWFTIRTDIEQARRQHGWKTVKMIDAGPALVQTLFLAQDLVRVKPPERSWGWSSAASLHLELFGMLFGV